MTVIRVCDTHPRRRAISTFRYQKPDVTYDRDLCEGCSMTERTEREFLSGFWESTGSTDEGTSLYEHRET